ncbi:MAG: putative metal-binding motif-containing protein [Myxococcota bacterium]|nr:putative metal-binding motif-containing protein [Myxococcota bacterium]
MRTQFITPVAMLFSLCVIGCPAPLEEAEVEGDAPGECVNGADDDLDGLYDCDDPDCWNAPDCKDDEEDTDTDSDDTADIDGDGFSAAQGDCDDRDADINPNAEEVCNNKDDDCDGERDNDPIDGNTYFQDGDGDGYGSANNAIEACDRPNGYVLEDGDCNDNNSLIHPGATETSWNGTDEDCDGQDFNGADCVDYAVDSALWWLDGMYADIGSSSGSSFIPPYSYELDWQRVYFAQGGYSIAETSATEFTATLNANLSLNSSSYTFELYMNILGVESNCEGYIAPTPMAFSGPVTLNVNGSGSVNGSASFSSQWSGAAESNLNLTSMDGGSCGVATFNTILGFVAPGYTVMSFFNEAMQQGVDITNGALEDEVEWYIQYGTECSQ